MNTRVGRGLRSLLESRIVWWTSERRALDGSPAAAAPLVVLLGREHYTERRKVYPIPGFTDLQRVLRLELGPSAEARAVIGPVRDDKRVVSFYDIDTATARQLVGAAWVIPESLVVASTLGEDGVALADRDGLAYFVAGSGESLPASGTLRSPDMFALAVGLPSVGNAQRLEVSALRDHIWLGLGRMPASAWFGLYRSPLSALVVPWRRVGLTAAACLFGYLFIASAWLGIVNRMRTAELQQLGPEVQTLLAARSQLERFTSERKGMRAAIDASPPTYPVWQVVSLALERGAQLTGLSLTGRELTLRGNAPSATDVLEALTKDPQLSNARFTLPVQRLNGNVEEFSLSVTLTGEGPHAK